MIWPLQKSHCKSKKKNPQYTTICLKHLAHFIQKRHTSRSSVRSYKNQKDHSYFRNVKYEILATAFDVMHFKTFLDLQEDKEEILKIVSNQITIKEDVSTSYSREMNEILDRYCTFTQDTEKGL